MPISDCNKEQKQAITHGDGPLLIVAGAGTGKTKVITERIAWLIMENKAKTDEVLALTFTEKAAQEMEERVDRLLPYGYVDLWIMTFHSFCDKILQRHCLDIGLSPDYKLLNETETWLLVRQNLDRFALDYYQPLGNPTKFIHALLKHFSRCKDEGIKPADYLSYAKQLKNDPKKKNDLIKQMDFDSDINESEKQELINTEINRISEVAKAFEVYQQILLENSALDFADLINYVIYLFEKRPQILKYYQKKFKYVLVDEYQDTNYVQNVLVKMLSLPTNNLTVVGDDDQSIYRFRGSSIENIMQFKSDFPDSKEIVLINNYRSAQVILDKAYEFIKQNNPHRLEATLRIDKKLISQTNYSGTVEHLQFDTAENEVNGVINKILQLKQNDLHLEWSDFAILVRANDSAQPFAQALQRAEIPYQFLALRGLYSKEVVMNVFNYFKLLDDYHESSAVYKVLNFPCWKIDHFDIVRIVHYAGKKTVSLFEAMQKINSITGLKDETIVQVRKILAQIESDSLMVKNHKVSEILTAFMYSSGYMKYITQLAEKETMTQISYLNQLMEKIVRFENANPMARLSEFMNLMKMELEAGETGSLRFELDEGPDMVRLMTVHGSKGLEFKYVFMVNLVDRKFPTDERYDPITIPEALLREDLSTEEDFHLEEERRLFYVAMTRAKQGLFFTTATDYGGARAKKISRFLIEMGYFPAEKNNNKKANFEAIKNVQPNEEITLSIPKKFSFSALNMYARCPRQFYYARVLKIPTFGKASFTFGDVIHKTLKDFVESIFEKKELEQAQLFGELQPDSKKKNKNSLAQLYEMYENNWSDDWYQDPKIKEKYYEEGKKILKIFYQYFQKQNPDVKCLEQPFSLELNGYRITGRIDRIDNVSGGVEIIDYKTGKPKDEKMSSDDKDQLLLYQMATEKSLKLKPINLTYYYLTNGKLVSFLGTDKQLENLKSKWVDRMNKIMDGDFTATPGPFVCPTCEFRDICPFRKI